MAENDDDDADDANSALNSSIHEPVIQKKVKVPKINFEEEKIFLKKLIKLDELALYMALVE